MSLGFTFSKSWELYEEASSFPSSYWDFKGQNYLIIYDTFAILFMSTRDWSVSEVTMEFLNLMVKFYGLWGSIYAVFCLTKEVTKFCLQPVEDEKGMDSHFAELAQVNHMFWMMEF